MPTDDKTNILIVDDREDKLLVLVSVLAGLGQNLVTARGGREALRRVLERDFAVILLDVYMPDMNGFETAALIRQRKQSAHTPIIFVTAYGDDTHVAEGYSLGAVDYIYSPVVPEILRTKVGVFVDLYRKTEQVKRQAEQQVALAREQTLRAAAEEATRRSDFLAAASAALASSLDFEATLRGLTRLLVPALADVAGVTVAGPPGHPWRGELARVESPGGAVHTTTTLTAPGAPADELRAALGRVLETGKAEVLERIDVARPAGGAAPVRLRAAAVLPLVARGRTLGALTLAQGPSGRRLARADVALAEDLAGRAAVALDNALLYRDVQEADRRKNEFLAMLAHELRNPLAPIRNALHVMRVRGPADPQLAWARDVIDRQVEHVVRLMDDLLDVSRITRGKIELRKEPVELAAVVARAVETSRPLIDERRHQLTVEPPPPLRVQGDPVRLAQVIANLLNNAAKYTEEGGRIALTVERDGGEAVVRVRDSGVGIPADMLDSIFDLFTQADRSLDRSQGGLGIGLTLVRSLVQMHGGKVSAHSAGPGQGSEFVVRLPIADCRLPLESKNGDGAEGTGRQPAAANRQSKRVLVVDDNVDAAESLSLLLRLSGHEVRVAHDGPAALMVADSFRPQVGLLDIGLPGMDGYEVARRLRRLPGGPEMLLVAVTGYGQDEDRRRSEEASFDHHLVKPIDPVCLPAVFALPGPRAV